MEKAEEKIGYRDVLSQKEYVKIMISNIINRFGDSVDAIAFTWLVYAITGSASWSAIIFALNQLPTMLVQPFAGALVERMNKKKLMVVSDAIRGLITVGLAALYLTGNVTPWILAAFTLINSSVEAFAQPAAMALVPQLIEEKYYAYGTSLNATISTVMQLIGLGAAGVIIGAFGIHMAILIDAVTFFGSALVRSLIRVKEENVSVEKLNFASYRRTLLDGISYLRQKPVIRNFCLMGVVINALIVPLNSLQSPLVGEVFGQGSEFLSIMSVAMTAGMGIGSFVFPAILKRFPVRSIIVASGIATSCGMGAYALCGVIKGIVPLLAVMVVFLSLLIGMGASMISAVLNVQFVKCVEQDYLARVGSIFNAGATAAIPVASVIVSAAAAVGSVSQIMVVSGVLAVLLFIYVGLRKVRFEEAE